MSFELIILGSGAAIPTGKRNPSSHYINCNERHILIDCGEGTQNQIRKFGIKIQKIKFILISHLHGDHYFGLIGLLSTMNLLGRTKGIKLFAPPQLLPIIELQLQASGYQYEFNLEFIPLENEVKTLIFEDKVIEIFSFPLKHRIKTFGFLIQEKRKELTILGEKLKEDQISLKSIPFFRKGENYIDKESGEIFDFKDFTMEPKNPRSYAYCSDTTYFSPIIESVLGVDLLYHEATFTEKNKENAKKTFHSTAKQAAEIALKARVYKLILGHFSSRYDSTKDHLKEAKTLFDNTECVEDGMKFYL